MKCSMAPTCSHKTLRNNKRYIFQSLQFLKINTGFQNDNSNENCNQWKAESITLTVAYKLGVLEIPISHCHDLIHWIGATIVKSSYKRIRAKFLFFRFSFLNLTVVRQQKMTGKIPEEWIQKAIWEITSSTWYTGTPTWSHPHIPSCAQYCTWRPQGVERWNPWDWPCLCRLWSWSAPDGNEARLLKLHREYRSCCLKWGRERWQGLHPKGGHPAPFLILQTSPCHRHPPSKLLHPPVHQGEQKWRY